MFKARRVRSRKWLSIVSCMVMLLAGLSACSSSGQMVGGHAFQNSNPIIIGVSLPLTKGKDFDFSSDGLLMKQGYMLWANTINSNGGLLGRPVQLNIIDDKSDPVKVADDYTQLIKEKVDLLFGPFSTLLTKKAENAKGISAYPFVEGAGGAPSVFNPGWPNLFAVSVAVANNLDTFVDYTLSQAPNERPKTAAYLSSDDPFTYPQINRAQGLLTQANIRTVYPTPANFKQYYTMPQFQYGPQFQNAPQYEYGEGDNNFAAEAAANAEAIVRAKPDVVVLGTLLPDIQAEIAVFKKDHFHPTAIIATAGPDLGQAFINGIGGMKYTEGMFVPNGWYPQANNYQNAAMVQAYTAQYNVPANLVNSDVAEAYAVGQVTQQAVEKVGSLNKAALLAEMRADTFNTVQGSVKFASDGHNELGLSYLFQWQNGNLIPVYPLSIASENPENGGYQF